MAASFQACVSAWEGDRSLGLKVEGRAPLQDPWQRGSGLCARAVWHAIPGRAQGQQDARRLLL